MLFGFRHFSYEKHVIWHLENVRLLPTLLRTYTVSNAVLLLPPIQNKRTKDSSKERSLMQNRSAFVDNSIKSSCKLSQAYSLSFKVFVKVLLLPLFLLVEFVYVRHFGWYVSRQHSFDGLGNCCCFTIKRWKNY